MSTSLPSFMVRRKVRNLSLIAHNLSEIDEDSVVKLMPKEIMGYRQMRKGGCVWYDP